MTDLDDLIATSLRRRADADAARRTPLSVVVARARSLRRARQRRASLVAVGGVLVIAATAAAVGTRGGPDAPSDPLRPATTATTQEPSAAGPALRDLPRGRDADRVVVGTTYAAGGTTVELPAPPYGSGLSAVTVFDDGFLLADDRFFEGSNGLQLVTADGAVDELGPGCTSGPGAVSADASRVAWATFFCPESTDPPTPTTLWVQDADGVRRSQELAPGTADGYLTSVQGFVGDAVVVNRGFIGGAVVTDLESPPRPIPHLGRVISVDDRGGLVAGLPAEQDDGIVVVDTATGALVWQAPDLYAGPFSPDGATMATTAGRTIELVDADDGSSAGSFELPPRTAVAEMVWENDEHLLLTLSGPYLQAVVRAGLDGTLELASDTYPVETRLLLAH